MTQQPGLRELKKQRTRQLIADTAMRLFLEHGFDVVTIAEVARAAEVDAKTVYNYFPSKPWLIYHRLETFEAALLDAVRQRKPGESILAAFSRFVIDSHGLIADETGTHPHDAQPWVVANALMGFHRTLIDFVRRSTLAGTQHHQLVRELRAQARHALAPLENGLARFGSRAS